MFPQYAARLATFALVTSLSSYSASCKLRQKTTTTTKSEDFRNGLFDISDLAFLYPPPGTAADYDQLRAALPGRPDLQDFWIPAGEIFDERLLPSLMDWAEGSGSVPIGEGAGIRLNVISAYPFSKMVTVVAEDGTERTELQSSHQFVERESMSLRDISRWRITSIRVDFCPTHPSSLSKEKGPVSRGRPVEATEARADAVDMRVHEEAEPDGQRRLVGLVTQAEKRNEHTPWENLVRGCKPELRLVAQPWLGFSNKVRNAKNEFLDEKEEFYGSGNFRSIGLTSAHGRPFLSRDRTGLFFADFAIHFFIELPHLAALEAEKNAQPGTGFSLMAELMKMKLHANAHCPTEGIPLGVHPCLEKELNERFAPPPGGTSSVYSQGLKSIVTNVVGGGYGTLKKVAMMGTDRSRDPWHFFQAEVFAGHQIKPVALPVSENPSNAGSAFSELSRQPKGLFFAGKMNFLNHRPIPRTTSEQIDAKRNLQLAQVSRIQPPLKKEFTGLHEFMIDGQFFNDPLDTSTDNKFIVSNIPPERTQQLIEASHRIENPLLVNQNTTDCVSCHLSTQMRELFAPWVPMEGKTSWGTLNDRSQLNELWTANKNAFSTGQKMPPLEGVTTATSFGYKSTKAAFSGSVKRYIVNQFSIFDLLPVVSERAVHQSAMSAGIWNRMAGGVLESDKLACEASFARPPAVRVMPTQIAA
jgi:hypothetical protein